MKFAKPAFVAIYSEKLHFPSGDIEQMVGRANRTQGTQEGRVFTYMENPLTKMRTLAWYKSMEALNEDAFGTVIAKALVQCYANMGSSQRQAIAKVLFGNNWKVNRETYEQIVP